jgi:general secretion pathway protein G
MGKLLTRRQAVRNAFTLIELLVVIVILAILATVVIQRVTHKVDDARKTKAMADIRSMADALEVYKLDNGRYPSSDVGLQALVTNVEQSPKWTKPYMSNIPNDPWGRPYKYVCPGESGKEFDISTVSPDDGEVIMNTN